jgi:hypothetical protein
MSKRDVRCLNKRLAFARADKDRAHEINSKLEKRIAELEDEVTRLRRLTERRHCGTWSDLEYMESGLRQIRDLINGGPQALFGYSPYNLIDVIKRIADQALKAASA